MATRVVVTCSTCGGELPLLPAFRPGEGYRLWHGSACVRCGRAFCVRCLETADAASCPACDGPTQPASLDVLRRARVVV